MGLMELFSKKEKVPEIPSAPVLPELPRKEEPEKKSLSELPSFPYTSKSENFNQEMVKSAVSDMPSPGENEVSVDIPTDLHITEEPREEFLIPPRPSKTIHELPKKRTLELNSSMENKSIIKQMEPIFVRIDKFQSAQKNFEQIKEKIKEIESIVGKIKDVRSKEEVELKGWTEDIEQIKSKLSEVNSEVFNQI